MPNTTMDRRHWLAATTRYAALGGLGLLTLGLGARHYQLSAEQRCRPGTCAGCGQLPNCDLPQAADFNRRKQR